MIYIGIDPGKSGAMAVIRPDRIEICPFDTQTYVDRVCDAAEQPGWVKDNVFVVVERVGAMPGQGVTSMFNFGQNFGFIQGLLAAYFIPYELVTPQKWKKMFGVTKDKNTSIEVCKRLFPEVSLRRTDKCRKDDDGMAEALLMAEYARRTCNNG